MNTKNPISWLTIKGFKSIKNLDHFRLDQLNVLIGANGAGKSNFVSYFRMLSEMVELRLQNWTTNQGAAVLGVNYFDRSASIILAGLSEA